MTDVASSPTRVNLPPVSRPRLPAMTSPARAPYLRGVPPTLSSALVVVSRRANSARFPLTMNVYKSRCAFVSFLFVFGSIPESSVRCRLLVVRCNNSVGIFAFTSCLATSRSALVGFPAWSVRDTSSRCIFRSIRAISRAALSSSACSAGVMLVFLLRPALSNASCSSRGIASSLLIIAARCWYSLSRCCATVSPTFGLGYSPTARVGVVGVVGVVGDVARGGGAALSTAAIWLAVAWSRVHLSPAASRARCAAVSDSMVAFLSLIAAWYASCAAAYSALDLSRNDCHLVVVSARGGVVDVVGVVARGGVGVVGVGSGLAARSAAA